LTLLGISDMFADEKRMPKYTNCEVMQIDIKNALLTLGVFPIKQTNFRLAHGPLTGKLRSLIAPVTP